MTASRLTRPVLTSLLVIGIAVGLVQLGAVPAAQGQEDAIVDGCSGSFTGFLDTIMNGRNPAACKVLDKCYDTIGATKTSCDTSFRAAAFQQCDFRGGEKGDQGLCALQAGFYQQTEDEYQQRQKKAWKSANEAWKKGSSVPEEEPNDNDFFPCRYVFKTGEITRVQDSYCTDTVIFVPWFNGCTGWATSWGAASPVNFCAFYDYAWTGTYWMWSRCNGKHLGTTSFPNNYASVKVCKDGAAVFP